MTEADIEQVQWLQDGLKKAGIQKPNCLYIMRHTQGGAHLITWAHGDPPMKLIQIYKSECQKDAPPVRFDTPATLALIVEAFTT